MPAKRLALFLLAVALGAGRAEAAPPRPPITGVSHIAVYSADMEKSEHFYVHDLGGAKLPDPEDPNGVRYYFSPVQFVEVLPLPEGAGKNRLDHVAFRTADAEALRRYMAAKGIAVPHRVTKARDGSRYFRVSDPEGNRVEFVQPPEHPQQVAPNPLSSHIIHVGTIVHGRAGEDAFYRDVLGFRPYWFGGRDDSPPAWISQQVPDGTDWLEYMVQPGTRGIPEAMPQATAGVLNHFSLGVANIRDAVTLLYRGGRLAAKSDGPKIGRDGKWQFNLYDPDGTRAEIMEFHAVAEPCCSPFTAEDPAN